MVQAIFEWSDDGQVMAAFQRSVGEKEEERFFCCFEPS